MKNSTHTAEVRRNKNGDALTETYFWGCFNNHLSETYSTAQIERDNALRLLSHAGSMTPHALDVALRWNLIPAEAETRSLSSLAKAAEPEYDGLSLFDLENEEFNALGRFLWLHLTVARCERTMQDWEAFYWHFLGDEAALDWDNPATREDCRRRFFAMLDECDWKRRDWETSGLSFDDLFEDEDETDSNAQAQAEDDK